MQQSLFVLAGGNMDFAQLQGLCDGEVDFQSRDQRVGGLIVELEAFHQLHITEVRGIGRELAQGLERANLAGFRQGLGDGLDFVADEDDSINVDVRVVEADLREVAVGVFADHAQQGGAFRVGGLDRLARAVGAHAVAGVAGDQAVLKQQRPRVAGTDMQNQRDALAHRWQIEQAAAGLQIDQARHFPVIDGADPQPAGDADAVHHRFVVGGFAEDVGCHRAGHGVRVEAQLGERFLVAPDD